LRGLSCGDVFDWLGAQQCRPMPPMRRRNILRCCPILWHLPPVSWRNLFVWFRDAVQFHLPPVWEWNLLDLSRRHLCFHVPSLPGGGLPDRLWGAIQCFVCVMQDRDLLHGARGCFLCHLPGLRCWDIFHWVRDENQFGLHSMQQRDLLHLPWRHLLWHLSPLSCWLVLHWIRAADRRCVYWV